MRLKVKFKNMPKNNLAQNNNLPEKSNLWIASNIAAGALLANIVIKFIGGIVFSQFVLGNFALELIYTIVIILIGAYFGSKFGVQYAAKRSIINSNKINSISKTTAIIPFIFLLLIIIEDIYVALSGVEKFELPFTNLLATLIFSTAVYYFCKKFLLEFVEKTPRADESINSSVDTASKNGNDTKILIGFIILALISVSAFFIWKSFKKDIVLVNPISTPSVAVAEDFSNPEASLKTFLKAYEVKNKEALLSAISKKSLKEIDERINFTALLNVNMWNDNLLSNYKKADYKVSEQTDKFAIMIPQNREIPDSSAKQDPLFKKIQTPRMGDMFFINEEGSWKIDISRVYDDVDTRGLYLAGYKTYSDGSSDTRAEKDMLEKQKYDWRKSFSSIVESTTTPISTPATNVTDWKTYRSGYSAIFPSEVYKIQYPFDWNYTEKRIAGERKLGKLETVFKNDKNEEIVKIIAGDVLSNYQDERYINKGEVSFGDLNLKFTKLEESSIGNVIYIFNTGENMIADSTQKGYDEIIVFSAMLTNISYLNNMVSTLEPGK